MTLLLLLFDRLLCQDDFGDMACVTVENDSIPCFVGNARTICKFEAAKTSTLASPFPFVPDCRSASTTDDEGNYFRVQMAQIAEVDTTGTYVLHRVVNSGYPVARLWTNKTIDNGNFDLRIVNASDSADFCQNLSPTSPCYTADFDNHLITGTESPAPVSALTGQPFAVGTLWVHTVISDWPYTSSNNVLQIQLILSAPTYDPVMQLRSIDIDNMTSVTTTISKADTIEFVVNEYKTATLFQVSANGYNLTLIPSNFTVFITATAGASAVTFDYYVLPAYSMGSSVMLTTSLMKLGSLDALYISLGVIGGVIVCGGIFFYVCARHGKKHRRFC